MVFKFIVTTVLVGGLLVPAKAEARCPVSDSNPELAVDFDKWQESMPEVDSVLGDAIKRLVKTTISPKASVHKSLTVNNRSVATWYSCDKRDCRGGVLFLNSNPDRLRVIRQGILPHNEEVGNRSGQAFRVLHTLIEDIDFDGNDEVIVRYEIDGPRRPTTGIQTFEYVAIYNLPDLQNQLFFRLGQHGGGDFQEFCSYGVERRDLNCDRRTDLLIVQECGMNMCFEEDAPQRDCKGQPKETKSHILWEKASDAYVVKGGSAPAKRIADDKPFLVIAGDFAVAGKTYLEHAKALKEKLVKAGFDKTAIHNSRDFSRLACCYRSVVVERFSDEKQAMALKKTLEDKGFKAHIKRGF